MRDSFSVPILSHAFNRQVKTVPSEVKPMLMDKDYKDMLKSQWGTGSTGSDSSAAHALADAHDDDDVDVVEEPMQPKVDKQVQKQKRRRLAPTHHAQYGDMAAALAGLVPIADESDAPALLALENPAPAIEDAADFCDAPALLALEGLPTAVDDPAKQPPSHTPVPAAQDHMAKTGAGATPAPQTPPLPLPSPPSPKAMFASSSSSSTAECSALAVPPPPLPQTPPAVPLHDF